MAQAALAATCKQRALSRLSLSWQMRCVVWAQTRNDCRLLCPAPSTAPQHTWLCCSLKGAGALCKCPAQALLSAEFVISMSMNRGMLLLVPPFEAKINALYACCTIARSACMRQVQLTYQLIRLLCAGIQPNLITHAHLPAPPSCLRPHPRRVVLLWMR